MPVGWPASRVPWANEAALPSIFHVRRPSQPAWVAHAERDIRLADDDARFLLAPLERQFGRQRQRTVDLRLHRIDARWKQAALLHAGIDIAAHV